LLLRDLVQLLPVPVLERVTGLAAAAPLRASACNPRRVRSGRCAIVRFERAADCASFTFRRAAST